MTHPTVLFPPSMARFSPDRMPDGVWTEHPGVAYDLIAALRPRLIVGVGIHGGTTYFACCQSVREHDVEALGYAVGLWPDDEPPPDEGQVSGFDVFATHNRARYADFSYILRRSVAQAANQFDDGSVDLVLVDEACDDDVEAAIEVWRPKVRPGGVLAVHDVGEPGSDRRAFWDRTADRGVRSLEFRGTPTLGLLRTPGPIAPDEQYLELLFGGDPADRERVRAIYAWSARYFELARSVGDSRFGHARRNRAGRASGAP